MVRRGHPKRSITRDIRTRRPIHPGREGDEFDAMTWPVGMRVRDRMTCGVVTIAPGALASAAAALMHSRRIRHLPVVRCGGRLIGIVTDRDLRQIVSHPAVRAKLGKSAAVLDTLTVRDLMTWGVVTVRPDTEIRQAAWLMQELKVDALPVLEAGRVVGILTETDVMKAFEEVLSEGRVAKPYRWALGWR